MRLIKQTEEYTVDTEQAAIDLIKNFREDAESKGYILGASGYTYKTKKAKGEIIGEIWIGKIVKILGGVWDEFE